MPSDYFGGSRRKRNRVRRCSYGPGEYISPSLRTPRPVYTVTTESFPIVLPAVCSKNMLVGRREAFSLQSHFWFVWSWARRIQIQMCHARNDVHAVKPVCVDSYYPTCRLFDIDDGLYGDKRFLLTARTGSSGHERVGYKLGCVKHPTTAGSQPFRRYTNTR